MDHQNKHVIRFFRITLILLIWYGVGIAAFSFSIQKTLAGIIELAVTGLIAYILMDDRLIQRLKDRRTPGAFIVVMYLLIAGIFYGIIRGFTLTDLYVLDKLHYPGLISYIRSSGLIIILAFLLWESIAITRLYFRSQD
jgi:hypothetical protein